MSPVIPTALMALVIVHSSFAESPKPTPPPVAPKGDVVDTYHGVKIADPYRAMENLKDPKVVEWMKAQSAYSTAVLDQIPGRKMLLQRIQELDKGAPYTVSDLSRLKDGTIFYQKLNAGAETRVICSRKSVTGEETVVLDPKIYESAGGSHASLEFFVPSPDGKFGVAGISKGGSEVTTIYVRDLAAGKDQPVSIDRIETAYNVPQWLPDSAGFFYSRRQKLPAGAPASETYKNTIAYLHKLGEPVEKDVAIFGFELSPKITFEPLDFPSVRVFPTSEYVIGQIHHGDSQELTLYTARRDALGQKTIPWKKVCGVPDAVVAFEIHGEYGYLVTSKDAPRYKVVRVALKEPDFANAEVVLPQSELVLTGAIASQSAVFVNATRNGSGVVVQVDPKGKEKPKRLEPPQNLTGEVAEASPFFPEIFVSTESWTKGGALYTYDPAKGEFLASALQPKGAFDDMPGYTSKEVEVKSHDGALVPLSIIYKEGLKLDGTNPLMLNGYGAYGSIRRAGFNPMNLGWLERGGVIAVAHVRGGGEKGKEWHTGGQKATKPNTWKDLIACAEYLIAEKYTSTGKLAIQGGSAGGILIGRAITERPDLFKVAIIMVGVTDMLRFETTENGPPNVQEYGSVSTPEGFKALLAMSALHQVKDGVKYPAVLLTHGLNDRRVDAWMSGKMTARLQEATVGGNPVLLLLDTEAGHGIGSKRSQIQEQLASRWIFSLWQMGEEGFQPAGNSK
jgi:prolyl oligopeptidase